MIPVAYPRPETKTLASRNGGFDKVPSLPDPFSPFPALLTRKVSELGVVFTLKFPVGSPRHYTEIESSWNPFVFVSNSALICRKNLRKCPLGLELLLLRIPPPPLGQI